MNRQKSKIAYDTLCQIIPGGVNSPIRSHRGVGIDPLIVERGKGDLIFNVDGNAYVDFCNSWGALLHGHACPEVIEAVMDSALKGTSFGIATEIEGSLGRKIASFVKNVEKIHFVSSGTEATMSAVRLARGFTGKNLIIKFDGNYHGHADMFLVNAGSEVSRLPTSSSKGVPDDMVKWTLSLPYNDEEAFRAALQDKRVKENLAAVIVEPVAGNMGVVPATPSFIKMLREVTKESSSLLIFDEVMTGFRVAKGGAQDIFGTDADLICFGKIMGGGFPAAAFGGRGDIMEALSPNGTIFQAGTLSGNPVAMQAGLTTLQKAAAPHFYEDLFKKVEKLIEPSRQVIEKRGLNACFQQVGAMFTLFFGRKKVSSFQEAKECDNKLFCNFFSFMLNRGIYPPPSAMEAWFISSAHTDEHLLKTSDAIVEFLSNC